MFEFEGGVDIQIFTSDWIISITLSLHLEWHQEDIVVLGVLWESWMEQTVSENITIKMK